MAVDTHGLEAIRKSAELVTPGDKSNCYLKTAIRASDGSPITSDDCTNALTTIDYAHHEIHEGSHYYIQGFLELADEAVFRVKLVTPDVAKWAHFVFSISSTGICSTTFDEDASGGMANGAAVVPINNNRNSENTSGLVLTSGVTAASTYVKRLENDKWGAQGFKQNIGGGSGREDEFMLKQNTTYLRTFTSGADDNIIQFRASWYEHTSCS